MIDKVLSIGGVLCIGIVGVRNFGEDDVIVSKVDGRISFLHSTTSRAPVEHEDGLV